MAASFFFSVLLLIAASSAVVANSNAAAPSRNGGRARSSSSGDRRPLKKKAASADNKNDDAAKKKQWGRTVRHLAEKWGDDRGTIQAYRDLETVFALHSIDEYMTETIHGDPFYRPVWDECYLKFEYCAEMASRGLCDDLAAAKFMIDKCAPACRMCHVKSYETRCPFDAEGAKHLNALEPGELNAIFERMVTDESLRRYGPITIHSMPGGGSTNRTMVGGPWVVTFENFLTEEECAKLRSLGESTGGGFARSTARFLDPTDSNDFRTSGTNWCVEECHMDLDVRNIHGRIERLLGGIPETNYEHLQILKYEEGQYYKTHHDYVATSKDRPQGVRVLTVFLYLNSVPSGGGTHFPDLAGGEEGDNGGLTIMPKMGRALIWPSVLDSDPNEQDPRMRHGAQTVVRGIKYGANAWVHMRDWKKTTKENSLCTDNLLSL